MVASVSFTSIPVVLILAYVPHFVKAGVYNYISSGRYDNVMPRRQWDASNPHLAKSPLGKLIMRASYAHANGLENFPAWAAAVLAAHARGVDESVVAPLAIAHMASRAVYDLAYIFGSTVPMSMLRSVAWLVSMGTTLYVMYLAC